MKLTKIFINNLDKVLSYGNMKFFQLRIKKIKKKKFFFNNS